MRSSVNSGRRSLLGAMATLPVACLPAVSWAQDAYPSKPLRMIIPFAVGGATDALGRDFAQNMGARIGQSIVIENMGGGAGVIAMNTLVRSDPDGYTLLFCASGNITSQPLLNGGGGNILAKVTPVAMVASAPHVLVVSARTPINSVQDLIDFAKAHPGELNFASAGVGGLAHLGTELFSRLAGIEVTHIPYKGAGQVMTDLAAGRIHAIFGTMPSFIPSIQNGSARPLGITAPSNATPLKGLPLISETVPGFTYSSWNAIFAPANTPAQVGEVLFEATKQALHDPGLIRRFDEQGVDLVLKNADELRDIARKEIVLWGQTMRDAGILLN